MIKILAFGASSSSQSINKQLATYTANRLEQVEVNVIDLNDLEMPIFNVDREKENGIPDQAKNFSKLISESHGVVISLAEHNGSYTTAFKNVLDWSSRLEGKLWQHKPMFLLSSSPGKRGGANVMGLALKYLPFMGADIQAHFSLPGFYENFSNEEGIKDGELKEAFEKQLALFQVALSKKYVPAS